MWYVKHEVSIILKVQQNNSKKQKNLYPVDQSNILQKSQFRFIYKNSMLRFLSYVMNDWYSVNHNTEYFETLSSPWVTPISKGVFQ
jgi:hypothetical protein